MTAKATIYAYAGCSTCKKAIKWLKGRKVELHEVPIVESPPSARELADLIDRSGLPAKKWFNTSGQSYRALIADKGRDAVEAMTTADVIKALARDGKLIKRPVVVTKSAVLVGFKEDDYARVL